MPNLTHFAAKCLANIFDALRSFWLDKMIKPLKNDKQIN
jgi:hypothetical protein